MPAEVLRLAAASGFFLAAVAVASLPDAARSAPARRPSPLVTRADRAIFDRVIAEVRRHSDAGPGARVAAAGLALLGTPYVAGTLEVPGPERLVCNLRELDCVTFVEASLALARTASHAGTRHVETFLTELGAMRYRDGEPRGYASRLHYFSEWLAHNAARGAITDVTADLGGVAETLRLDYMSGHRKLYPALAAGATFEAVRRIEERLSGRTLDVIPRERVAAAAEHLQDGDILAFVPTTPGLDVSHTGLAHRGADGVARLLHAPDVGEQVRLDPESLAEYVAGHAKVRGLLVARPQ